MCTKQEMKCKLKCIKKIH